MQADPTTVVNFLLLPENKTHTETFSLTLSLRATKPSLAQVYGVHPGHITLSVGADVVSDETLLSQLKDDPLSDAAINLCAHIDWTAQQQLEKKEFKMPDVLEVQVGWPDDEHGLTTVFVKVIREDL